MLLALWSGFWDVNDWTGVVPPPTPTPTPPPGAGGGHWRDYHEHESRREYYEEREKMLRRYAPRHVPEHVEEAYPEVAPLVAKRNEVVLRMPEMPDLQSLRDMDELIHSMDLQIRKYEIKCEDEALLALIL